MLYSYVPSLVKCYIFGVELKGLAKDTVVTIERIGEVSTFRKAQDGSYTAFNDSIGSYRVTFHIEQVSPSNDFLHTIFKLHQRTGLNLAIPLSVQETVKNGGTQFTSFDVFFETEPTAEFTSQSTARQWSFICNTASYSLSGTSDTGFLTGALRATIRLIELSEAQGFDLGGIEGLIDKGIVEAEKRLNELF